MEDSSSEYRTTVESRPRSLQSIRWVLLIAGAIGGLGLAAYNAYMLCHFTSLRWTLVHFYLIVFAMISLVAELGFLRTPRFEVYCKFLTTRTGRGLFYIFLAGLMWKGWGIIIAAYLTVLGVLNFFAGWKWNV